MVVGFVAMIVAMFLYTQIPARRLVRRRPAARLPRWSGSRCRSRSSRSRSPRSPGSQHHEAGPRVGPAQHGAAGRRRDRRRGRLVGLDQPLQPPDRVGRAVRAGVHERLAVGVLGDVRGRDRRARGDAHPDPARRARAGGRGRPGPRPEARSGSGPLACPGRYWPMAREYPTRPRPGRVDADRPARPDLARRARARSSRSSST